MSKRILVVEDQEDNRQILRDLLGQNIPFVAKYDGTNPPCKIEYTSTETAAW